MKLKSLRNLLGVGVMLLIFLSACGDGTTSTDEPSTDNGETSSNGDGAADGDDTGSPDSPEPSATVSADIRLDPATVGLDDEDSLTISGFVYEGLVGGASGGQVVSALAESWTISEDQLDYVFVLRPDATFHDGTPVTADAVMANFNRWFDPENPLHGEATYEAWETYFLGFKGDLNADDTPVSSFDGIEKVDDRTVLIHLNRIVPEFLEYIAKPSFSILNPDALATYGDAYGTSADSVSGTGPYIVSEWSTDKLVLDPYSGYWGTPQEETLEFGFE
jgi:peptide/nickel transport system substrate-binding protein